MKKKILGLLAVGLLVGPMAASAVVIDNKDWRQLTGTVGFTPAEVLSICGSGLCSGGTGALSVLNGWLWATPAEVLALFEELIQPGVANFQPVDPPGSAYYEAFNDPDIDAAIGPGGFEGTDVQSTYERVHGWARDCIPNSTGRYACFFGSLINGFDPNTYDTAGVLGYSQTTVTGRGVWLYRPASTVPEPGTLALLGFGLAGLGVSRRRKAN